MTTEANGNNERQRFTAEQKQQALEYAATHGVVEASATLGISKHNIYSWRKAAAAPTRKTATKAKAKIKAKAKAKPKAAIKTSLRDKILDVAETNDSEFIRLENQYLWAVVNKLMGLLDAQAD